MICALHYTFIKTAEDERPSMEAGYSGADDYDCPVPCQQMLYTPSISYSALSDAKLKQLLMDPRIHQIKSKFEHALEVEQRVSEGQRYAWMVGGRLRKCWLSKL